ncbi:MAG: hypothetical protein GY703_11090 [Gammaproteobacteria bacterium]|nr:hypothetical protein [Gammaproteobacteria bacterium]
MANAITYHGWPGVLRDNQHHTPWFNEYNQRFIAIVLLIRTYVYAFIPHVDFLIATALFLFAFISAFYLERHEPLIISTLVFLVTDIVVLLAGNGVTQNIVDLFTTAVLAVLIFVTLRFCRNHDLETRRFQTTLLVALLVPLLLCPIFRFGLLVPLPSESFYIDAMEQLRYLLKARF